jgi:voltage-gated potassium channel
MIMLTLGSNTWPVTAEGRLLCVLLSLYAFTVLGYLTATLASMFIGSDASGQAGAAEPQDVADIKAELATLRLELQTLTERLTKPE